MICLGKYIIMYLFDYMMLLVILVSKPKADTAQG